MIRFSSDKWEGLDGMGDEILRELRPKGEFLVEKAAQEWENDLKLSLKGQRTGKQYPVPDTQYAIHIAAGEGEPPGVLHGHLSGSIGHTHPKWSGWEVASEVGVGLGAKPEGGVNPESYARRLEYGGVHVMPKDVRIRMVIDGEITYRWVRAGTVIKTPAKPYMEPSQRRMEPRITAIFEAGL